MTAAGSPLSAIDLHTHSTASDGTDSPGALVERAAHAGLRTLALTDHDTTGGIAAATDSGRRLGVVVIPGVELSTDVGAGELHMLGYFIDPSRGVLHDALRRLRDGRARRAERIAEQLRAADVPIALGDVERLAGDGAVGRAHVARVLVANGHASTVDDAFARYLVPGRPGYVPRPRLNPAAAVALIHGAGGAAVLAHPDSVADLDAELRTLLEVGLDGLESYYAAYPLARQQQLAALAARLGLIATGGSDFHGPGEREGSELGAAPVPDDVPALLAGAAANWSR